MIDAILGVLAVIGALSTLATAGVFFLAWTFGRRNTHQNRRLIRRQRNALAQLPAENVAADAALWSDFWTAHELPKEDKP